MNRAVRNAWWLVALPIACAITLMGAAQDRPPLPTPPPPLQPENTVATPVAPPRSIVEFRPSQHGFRFRNDFSGTPLPRELGGLGAALGAAVGAPSRFGLCGGMSFAAADYFLAGAPIPQTGAIPVQGAQLFDLIYARQIASFDGLNAPRVFAEWMHRPDAGPLGTRRLSLHALPGIVSDLELGRPVVLGLVFASAAKRQMLWENHQVLAWRADVRSGGGRDLRVYDPNFPGNDGVIVRCVPEIVGFAADAGPLAIATPLLGLRCELIVPPTAAEGDRPIRRKAVRGLFAMPYSSAPPPDGL